MELRGPRDRENLVSAFAIRASFNLSQYPRTQIPHFGLQVPEARTARGSLSSRLPSALS